jgi:rhodanese-related sulfurtransferase
MRSLLLSIFLLIYGCIAQSQVTDSLKFILAGPVQFDSLMKNSGSSLLVDVRMPGEFRKEHIPNSVNIPLLKSGKKHRELLRNNPALFLYCKSGVRSRWAARKYYDLGYRSLYSLDGGIEAWKKAGKKVSVRGGIKK